MREELSEVEFLRAEAMFASGAGSMGMLFYQNDATCSVLAPSDFLRVDSHYWDQALDKVSSQHWPE